MQSQKMNHPNDGIQCMVNTCDYYMADDHCSAQKIQVAPKNAKSTQETGCVTFAPQAKA